MLSPSGTVEGELVNPARAGRQQRQSVFLCRGSLAYLEVRRNIACETSFAAALLCETALACAS